jgi:cell division septation protein DedD
VATAVDGGGAYRLQLAAVRSRAEATALAERARQQHPDVLKGRRTEVDEAVFGNMGTFYRARIGPFASNIETEAICASLRAKGQDCMVIGQ